MTQDQKSTVPDRAMGEMEVSGHCGVEQLVRLSLVFKKNQDKQTIPWVIGC